MEEKLIEIFRSVFTGVEPTDVNLNAEFREWDQYSSLTQVVLLDAITSKLNVKIKLRSFIKAQTIGDILDIIEEE